MTRARRRAVLGVVTATLVIATCAVVWCAATALRRLDEIEARASMPPAPKASGWAPAEAFTYEFDAPEGAVRDWVRVLAEARDERLPAPPAELVAWLDAHCAEVDELANRVRATGPIELPDFDDNIISSAGPRRPIWAAVMARRLLVASAGVAVFEERHDLAERRLDAAWTLTVSRSRLRFVGTIGSDVLGALRVLHPSDPRAWLERLDAVDQRSESGDHLAATARWTVREVHEVAEREVPRWLPGTLRRVAVRVAEIPSAWVRGPGALARLDARHALLAQEACDDPAELIVPSWTRELDLPQWIPAVHRARVIELELAQASAGMGNVNLTRHVLASRAGIAGYEPCGGPRFHAHRRGSRVTINADAPPSIVAVEHQYELPRSFTFDAPALDAPVLASAPADFNTAR